jgi:Ca2+-binding RTX toxin-like protein
MEFMTISMFNSKLWLKSLDMFIYVPSKLANSHISFSEPLIIKRLLAVLLLFKVGLMLFLIGCSSISILSFILDYENPKIYGLEPVDVIVQYSDSIIPQNIYNQNVQNQNLNNNSTVIDGTIPKIIIPSSPSELSGSSSLVIDGNNNIIISNKSNTNTNNINSFFGSEQQLNQYRTVDNICGYMNTVKIGYIITGTGNISGNNQDNYIIGSELNDLICGKAGNDVIMGLGGNDIVYAGKGDDTLYGGDGNNQLFGEDGDDNIIGGPFNDLLVGGKGNDHINSSTGDDIMIGGAGADYFECGSGLNTVVDYNPTNGDLVSNGCAIVNNIGSQ